MKLKSKNFFILMVFGLIILMTMGGCETVSEDKKMSFSKDIIQTKGIDKEKLKYLNSLPSIFADSSLLELNTEEFEKEYAKLPDDYKFKLRIKPKEFKELCTINEDEWIPLKLNESATSITKKQAEKIVGFGSGYIGEKTQEVSLRGLRFLPNIKSIAMENVKVVGLSELAYLKQINTFGVQDFMLGNEHESLNELKYITSGDEICIDFAESNLKNIDFLKWFPETSKNMYSFRYNQLEDISSLSHIRKIHVLFLRKNLISNINPLSNLEIVSQLDLEENRIQDLSPLSNLKEISSLNLSKNKVNDLTPISHIKDFRNLMLSENSIQDITPLSNIEKIEFLDLSFNPILDNHQLVNLHNIKSLLYSGNKLDDLNLLIHLKELEKLIISDNSISDITPLLKLRNLKALSLQNNIIKDIQVLYQLPNLEELDIRGNPNIPDHQIKELENKNKDLNIVHHNMETMLE